MPDSISSPLLVTAESHGNSAISTVFSATLGGLSTVFLVLYSSFVQYDEEAARDSHVQQYYMWYIHVAVMIFVGFGFLMTFLKRYSYTAVGLNFCASCLAMLEAVLCIGAAQQHLWGDEKGATVKVDFPLLIDAAFCAGACMITFGAVLGKASPTQVLWLIALEVPIYAINQMLVTDTFGALDIGGSITIHAFGAYFGLAASMFISRPGSGACHPKNKAIYVSDVTAMIGTVFLWIFWPSFNGALASEPSNPASAQQFYCVANTITSLLGACLAAFTMSAALHGKLNMVHIQNATLAGGVAIGSSANLGVPPGFALGLGLLAGSLSVVGYQSVMPWLESKISLRDTCGVHNLHGMPGVLGGVAAAVAAALTYSKDSNLMSKGRYQPVYQLLGLGLNLCIALLGGALAGAAIDRFGKQRVAVHNMFDDAPFWAEVEEEKEEEKVHPSLA